MLDFTKIDMYFNKNHFKLTNESQYPEERNRIYSNFILFVRGRRHLNQLSKSMGGSRVYLCHVINLLTGISDLYTTCNYTSVYPTFSRDYVIVDERRH